MLNSSSSLTGGQTHTHMVLVTSTKLVSRKSSFDMSVFDASWRVPIGEPITNSIQWKTYWCMGWSYVSWDTKLIVAIVFMSTQHAGGCHELLLGCYLNPLLSWSKLGWILIALACLCVNWSLPRSSLYIGINMVILAYLLCCIVCCATSTLGMRT